MCRAFAGSKEGAVLLMAATKVLLLVPTTEACCGGYRISAIARKPDIPQFSPVCKQVVRLWYNDVWSTNQRTNSATTGGVGSCGVRGGFGLEVKSKVVVTNNRSRCRIDGWFATYEANIPAGLLTTAYLNLAVSA
jgi:hypothetical protein